VPDVLDVQRAEDAAAFGAAAEKRMRLDWIAALIGHAVAVALMVLGAVVIGAIALGIWS
jgi:hypothetical protein